VKLNIMVLAVSMTVSNMALANVNKDQNKAIKSNSRDISRLEKANDKQDRSIARVDSASEKRDEKLQRNIDRAVTSSEKRDAKLDRSIDRVDTQSVKRDEKLARQVDRYDTAARRRDDRQNVRISRNADRINTLGEDISHLRSDMYSAVAGVAAMGAIPQAGAGRTAIGIGYGNFGGTEASAFGISHRTENGKHAFSASGTMTEQENGFAVGYSYSF